MMKKKKELIKKIAGIAPDPAFIQYIYYMLSEDDQKEQLLEFIDQSEWLTKQQLNIKALDIHLGR
ncbi:MAG: hypothetical protein LUF00_09165 [Lachnospiraceae bacterium]|nr:hypothetical protein [Lachnospiraceae bacterium]